MAPNTPHQFTSAELMRMDAYKHAIHIGFYNEGYDSRWYRGYEIRQIESGHWQSFHAGVFIQKYVDLKVAYADVTRRALDIGLKEAYDMVLRDIKDGAITL
jgi:hypothetical protein